MNNHDIIGGLVIAAVVITAGILLFPEPPAGLHIPVATQAEAKRLSSDTELGRYFDCLEWIPTERVLQTCEGAAK